MIPTAGNHIFFIQIYWPHCGYRAEIRFGRWIPFCFRLPGKPLPNCVKPRHFPSSSSGTSWCCSCCRIWLWGVCDCNVEPWSAGPYLCSFPCWSPSWNLFFWKMILTPSLNQFQSITVQLFFFESDHRMIKGLAGVVCCAIQTDFTWRNSLIDSCPLSLPLPERLYPPKGLIKLTAR